MCPIYVAARLGRAPVECRTLHEPVDGWAWIECSDAGALLRDVARAVAEGFDASLSLPSGPLDPLRVDEFAREMADPILNGVFVILCPGRDFAELVRLGARRIEWRQGWRYVRAQFRGARVVELLRRKFIPVVWV